jgi:putative transposase
LEKEIRRFDAFRTSQAASIGRRKFPVKAFGGGFILGQGDAPGGGPKKTLKPARVREMVEFFKACYHVSTRRACSVINRARSTFYYKSHKHEQAVLRKRIKEIAAIRVRYGYKRIHTLLKREGWVVNHKRVYRLYCEEGLQMRHKSPKRRVSAKLRNDRTDATQPNECWSMDFMSDELFNGRRIRVLTIVDNFSRVSPFIGVGYSYKGYDVVTSLETAARRYGIPSRIRVDNGPEFVSKELDLWAYANGVVLDFSRPGKPTDNAFIESFNSNFRKECLNQHWFLSIEDAENKVEVWRRDYNTYRPHSSIGDLPPAKVYADVLKANNKLPAPQKDASDEQNEAHSRRPLRLVSG